MPPAMANKASPPELAQLVLCAAVDALEGFAEVAVKHRWGTCARNRRKAAGAPTAPQIIHSGVPDNTSPIRCKRLPNEPAVRP